MTEKRYTIFGEWHKDCVIDEIRDNTGEYVTIGRVVDLLNENEQLKKELESFKPIIFESDGKPVTLYKKGDVECL